MHKVAIIDDDHAITNMYQFKLEIGGYDIRVAHNGIEGLGLAKEFKPDLLLLDLSMPLMTGDVMLQRLRAEDWGKDMRVIVMTNISRDEAPAVLRFLHVDRYIVKAHHTPKQILDAVNEILK